MQPLDFAALSWLLRLLHYIALLICFGAIIVWCIFLVVPRINAAPSFPSTSLIKPSAHRIVLEIVFASALAAAATAQAWPIAYFLYAWPEAASWRTLTALWLTAGSAWLPAPASLWHLHPDWPLAWRPEPDIPISHYAQQQLHTALLYIAAIVTLLTASLWLRPSMAKWGAVVAASVLWLLRPDPAPQLLLVEATPSTFQQPTTPLAVDDILIGRTKYRSHCAQCHGLQADGQGSLAPSLPTWPSVLGSAMFQQKHAGDIFWHVRSPLHGAPNAPFGRDIQNSSNAAVGAVDSTSTISAAQLSDADVWRILDYLRVLAAGQEIRTSDGWRQALQAPDFALRCHNSQARRLQDLRGRLVQLVTFGQGYHVQERLMPDPRLIVIAVTTSEDQTLDTLPVGVDCIATSTAALHVLSLTAGIPEGNALIQRGGVQLLLDRQGWLRSRALPGEASGWSASDTMCGPDVESISGGNDDVDTLIRTIETTPVDPPRFRMRMSVTSGNPA